jgi:hypothetical protein
MPIPMILQSAGRGADDTLGRDLLDIVIDGLEIGEALVELMASVSRITSSATRMRQNGTSSTKPR